MNQELPKPLREALARQAAGEVHPSPDALTAFVEHSLPIRESRRVTDHLARCSDCREVVFLASSAVEEPVGEERELMPDTAVPRISPALQAKMVIPRIMASVDADTEQGEEPVPVPVTPRRGWMLRWAWVPAVAVIVLVIGLLIERSELGHRATQSAMIIATKGQQPAATNSPQAPTGAPGPELQAKLAAQKPGAKSLRAQSDAARDFDTIASAPVVSKATKQYPSAPMAPAAGKLQSPPAPDAIMAYQSAPAAVPQQNAFVESQAPNAPGLVLKSRSALEKPQMGLLPAIATRRQWRISPDGHVEYSAAPGNWVPVLAGQPATFHVVSVIGDNVWAGGSGGVLFHSADDGQTWSKKMLSSPSAVETSTIVSIGFSDALHGVITTDAGSRWNTSDGGITWTKE